MIYQLYHTIRTEGGNTIMTTEYVTSDFTESGTTAFAESGTTTLPKRRTSTTSSTVDSSTSADNGRPGTSLALRSGSSTARGITNATEWGTSGTVTWWSREESPLPGVTSGSSPFALSFTSDVPSPAFHRRDSVTGWNEGPNSAFSSSSSSTYNDTTTALNDTDGWGFYGGGGGSPAWGPGSWSVDALDGYPYPSLYGWGHIVVASVVVTAIMLLIVMGNVLVIVAVARDRNLSGIQNWFITSLALSDLFVGLFIMPLSLSYELMGYWTFGDVLCELWLATDVLLCTASILNLVLISLDRYWSITRAISYVRQRTKRRAVLMIGAVWVMSMIISLPPLVGWKRPQPTKFGYPLCVLSEEPGYVLYSTMGSFYLPLVVMVIVYLKIYLAARNRARRNLRKTPPREGNHCKTTRSGATTTTTTTTNNTKNNTKNTSVMDPRGKHKNAAVDRLSPTRETSSGSPSSPHPPLPIHPPLPPSLEERDEMEADVELAQVTIESISPSTPPPSPDGEDQSTTVLTFSAVSSPVGPPPDAAASKEGLASSLHDVATVVHSHDVAPPVVSSCVVCSSVVHSPDVVSSVVQSSDDVALSVAPKSVVAPSSAAPPSVVASSVTVAHSSGVASFVIQTSVADPYVVHTPVVPPCVVPPCVVQSSVAYSPVVASSVVASSSVVQSSDVAPIVVHSSHVVALPHFVPSLVSSPVLHSPAIPSPSASPSPAPPSVSTVRARPQRLNQARRSPTTSPRGSSIKTSNPPNGSPPFASISSSSPPPAGPAPSSAAPSPHSDRHRRAGATSNRRSYVTSITLRRSSNPRSNGVKDVEKMKRKMARARERRATVVLGIVMASFIGCWLPFFSLYPITLLVGLQLPDKLFAVIFWLGYCNSALNPIIYTIFNRDFRQAFQRIICPRRPKRF